MTGGKNYFDDNLYGKTFENEFVQPTGVHLLFCIKWLKGCCWSRYKLHSVNFRFGTPV